MYYVMGHICGYIQFEKNNSEKNTFRILLMQKEIVIFFVAKLILNGTSTKLNSIALNLRWLKRLAHWEVFLASVTWAIWPTHHTDKVFTLFLQWCTNMDKMQKAYTASTYTVSLRPILLMRLIKTIRHHLTHKLHVTNINLNSSKSGASSGSSLDERYFPSRHNVSLLRSRWAWTKAQLPQQMTDGGPWNQPSHITAQISRSIWSNLWVPVLCH